MVLSSIVSIEKREFFLSCLLFEKDKKNDLKNERDENNEK